MGQIIWPANSLQLKIMIRLNDLNRVESCTSIHILLWCGLEGLNDYGRQAT